MSIGTAVDEMIRKAYEHGYAAGLKNARKEWERESYRRGYMTGYGAARRGHASFPDGCPDGRPRRLVA